MSNDTGVARLIEVASKINIAMITTIDAEGHLIARPMGQQDIDADGTLWYFTERDSHIVTEIRANPHVGVTLSASDAWVAIDGEATIVEDSAKAQELWDPSVEAWLPQGPTDPSVVLIKVDGHGGEYWDTPGSKVATLISFVKSKVTGQPFDGGESEKVDL